jgi:hypothetical protein
MSSKQNQRTSTRRTKAKEPSEPVQQSLPLRYKKSHFQKAVINVEKVVEWFIFVPTREQALKDKRVPKYAPFQEFCIGKLVITVEDSNEANQDMMEESDDDEPKQIIYTRFLIPTFQQPVSSSKDTRGVADTYTYEKDADGNMHANYSTESFMQLVLTDGVVVYTTKDLHDKPAEQRADCLEAFFLPFSRLKKEWVQMSSPARIRNTTDELHEVVNQHYGSQRDSLSVSAQRYYPKTLPATSLKNLAALLCIYQAGGYHKYEGTTDGLPICMLPDDTSPKDFRYVL